ncbi:MAG: hypothetical protein J6S69_06045 [Proteobacteria bacterium]|jgi:hypothetical protein|nr:hypothetical protein [Pseudomonadota bacterium]
MPQHVKKLAIYYVIATLCMIGCAIGMLTSYHHIAIIAGMALVFMMTCGFFYATLHLQKMQ